MKGVLKVCSKHVISQGSSQSTMGPTTTTRWYIRGIDDDVLFIIPYLLPFTSFTHLGRYIELDFSIFF